LKTTHLEGYKAEKIISIWENFLVSETYIRRPTDPYYGLRFYNHDGVCLEAELCWWSFSIVTKSLDGEWRVSGGLFGNQSSNLLKACLNNGFPHLKEIGIRVEVGIMRFLSWVYSLFTK
jgi:hypothetical protein